MAKALKSDQLSDTSRPTSADRPAKPSPEPQTAKPTAEQALRQNTAPLAERPQSWQSWLTGSMKALVDQAMFSKEALFHTLAAKDGVNYFELPIPWASSSPAEIWIESDDDPDPDDSEKSTHRLLLALHFSALGETRIGMESSHKRLSIRIWTENPQFVENEVPQMTDELSALGYDALVSLHALFPDADGAVPSIKSIINGSSLHAMG
jgi:hypothetical protein